MASQALACPRCGTPAAAHQKLCIECGEKLAGLSLPGGWLLRAAAALAVAVATGAVAIAISKDDGGHPVVAPTLSTSAVTTAPAPAPVSTPSAAPITSAPATTAPAATTSAVATTTAAAATPPPPAAPAVPAAAPGATTWPAGRNGWTVVIASLPRSTGARQARARAAAVGHAGLPQTGVLVSDSFASLQPGYLVVFSGVYGQLAAAQQAAAAAQSSFPGAYSRHIAR